MQPAEQPTQLLIVRRGRVSTFRILERHFVGDPSVRIIWDRRHQERRRSSGGIDPERRHADRRAAVSTTVWPPTNYLVVSVR